MALEQLNSRQGFSRSGKGIMFSSCAGFSWMCPFQVPCVPWALVTGGPSQMNPKWRAAPPWSILGHPNRSHMGKGGWLW